MFFRPKSLILLIPVWVALAQPPSLNLPVRSVALDTSNPPVVFAAAASGLFRSTDNGLNFRPLNLRPAGQVQPYIWQVVIHKDAPQTVYAAADVADGGVWRSTDGGNTWVTASTGLTTDSTLSVDSLVTIPGEPKILYAKAGGQLYKTVNSGDKWVLQGDLPKDSAVFAVTPTNPKRMYAALGTSIQISDDEGATWKQSPNQNLLPLSAGTIITSIQVDPVDPTIVYLAALGGAGSGIYKSGDSGEFFQFITLSAIFRPVSIQISPAATPILLVSSVESGIFYRSLNRGITWQKILVAPNSGFVTITPNPKDPLNGWAGAATGVYETITINSLLGPFVDWAGRSGFTRGTIAAPPFPYEFILAPGQQGFLNYQVRVLETDRWTLNYNMAGSGEPWLTLGNSSGVTPVTATIRVNAANLAAGNYTANIRINSNFAANDPVNMPVRLTVRTVAPTIPYAVSTYAGTGGGNSSGDNVPARLAGVNAPDSVAVDAQGNLYISDPANNIVRKVAIGGTITRYAGNGQADFNGDGGEARVAALNTPRGLALDSKGFLYIVDSGNSRIRRVSPDGVISTFAANTGGARGIAVDPTSGDVYLTFPILHLVLRFTPDGQRSFFAGSALVTNAGLLTASGFRGDGDKALYARMNGPQDVAVDWKGNVYIADSDNHRVRVVSPDGKIRTAAGHGSSGFQGDGGDAVTSALNHPVGLATDADGNLYIAEDENNRVRVISADGKIRTLAGTGTAGFSGDGANAAAAQFRSPSDVAVDPDGNVYVADRVNNRIRLLAPPPKPKIDQDGMVNLIDNSKRLAPGSLFRLRGSSLAASTQTAARDEPWPTSLNSVTLTIAGKPARLAMVSSSEITGQIPPEATTGPVAVRVVKSGRDSGEFMVTLLAAAPTIILFANDAGETITSSVAGSTVVVYFTGLGLPENPVTATLGERDLEVVSVEASATQQGVALATVKLPEDVEPGDYDLTLKVLTESSRKTITVTAPPAAPDGGGGLENLRGRGRRR